MSTTKFIYVNQNTPATQYLSFGQPPYPIPPIPHPIISSKLVSKTNHQLIVEVDTTQSNNLPLDLVVNYQLFLAPKESNPKPVKKGSTLVLSGNQEIQFSKLVENKIYQLQLEFYNPYYPQIAGTSSTSFQTSNSNTIDLLYQGPQDQDRDNSLTLTIYLEENPKDITISLVDVQQMSQPPLLEANMSEKPSNSELVFQITNIPDGLYQFQIDNNSGVDIGIQRDYTITRYDQGKTDTQVLKGSELNGKKTIMMLFGKLRFTTPFTNNLGNLTSLDQQMKKRSFGGRRGAFLSTSGSFTLSSGGPNAAGTGTGGSPLEITL